MPFIRSYNGAMQQLSSIGTGKCKGECMPLNISISMLIEIFN